MVGDVPPIEWSEPGERSSSLWWRVVFFKFFGFTSSSSLLTDPKWEWFGDNLKVFESPGELSKSFLSLCTGDGNLFPIESSSVFVFEGDHFEWALVGDKPNGGCSDPGEIERHSSLRRARFDPKNKNISFYQKQSKDQSSQRWSHGHKHPELYQIGLREIRSKLSAWDETNIW